MKRAIIVAAVVAVVLVAGEFGLSYYLKWTKENAAKPAEQPVKAAPRRGGAGPA